MLWIFTTKPWRSPSVRHPGAVSADLRFTRHLRLNDGYSGNQKVKAALKLLGKMVAEAH